jgi:hypothetical protein
MTADEVLADLRDRGFRLTVRDGKIQVAPASQLTDGDRAGIRENRTELLALLAADPGRGFLWWETCGDMTDIQYDAVVAFDLLTYGVYRPSRRYDTPAASPAAIWQRLGLRRCYNGRAEA